MSVAEKLQQIADNQPKVHDAGKKSIFKRIQDGGKTQNYYYAFAYDRFDDTNYCPVYPIKFSNGTTPGRYVFFGAIGITDTKVEIVANSNNMDHCFNGCTNLVTIRKLTVTDTTDFNSAFSSCSALENITIGGTIGQNISFSASPKLTHDSLMSIIEHLGTVTSTKTLTLGTKNLAKLTDGEKAIATQKGWTLA